MTRNEGSELIPKQRMRAAGEADPGRTVGEARWRNERQGCERRCARSAFLGGRLGSVYDTPGDEHLLVTRP